MSRFKYQFARYAGVALAVSAAALTLTAIAAPASARPMTTAPAPGGGYAVNRPLCAIPASIYTNRCLGLRRVSVGRSTPGAYEVETQSGAGPGGGITPAQLATAYGFDPTTKVSQTVAIIDWYDDPDVLSDLKHYDAHYNLATETTTSFRKVNQRGTTAPLPQEDHDSAGEIALDVESVRAVCHTCKILLVEVDSPTDAATAAGVDLAAKMGATEISNSYGAAEHKVSTAVYNAFNHPGVVITASSGDDGWFDWDYANEKGYSSDGKTVFPSTHPDVVSVGGTGLTLTSDNHRKNEYVWNENGADDRNGLNAGEPEGASGGGCSTYYTAQVWQRDYKGYPAACKGKRLSVDIAALADPQTGFSIYDTYGTGAGGWVVDGGTSLASPLTAAMFALRGGAHGAAYPAASLYVNGTHRASSLFDVIDGGNGFCAGDTVTNCATFVSDGTGGDTNNPNALGHTGGPAFGVVDCSFPRNGAKISSSSPPSLSHECNAATGYDGPSGLGTPRTSSAYAAANPSVTIKHTATPRRAHKVGFSAKATARVSGSKAATWVFSWGDGQSTTAHTYLAYHTYASAGPKSVRVTVGDNLHQTTIARTTVTIGT